MASSVKGRLLLTGATGFIGQHVQAQIHNYEILAIGKETGRSKIIAANLLEDSEIRKVVREFRPTHLLHLAWEATPGTYWTDPVNHEWVRASELLYREFLENGGQRAVFAGSVAEYEWKSQLYIEDQTPINPATLYGQCKAELFARLTAIQRNRFAWARLFYLYGENEASGRLVSSAFQALLNQQEFPTTNGEQIRDFLNVKDVASALIAILESRAIGAINVGSGEPTRVRDIIQTVGELTRKQDLVRFGQIPQRPNDPPQIVADVQRLKQIGWSPRYDLQTGLKETYEWWKTKM